MVYRDALKLRLVAVSIVVHMRHEKVLTSVVLGCRTGVVWGVMFSGRGIWEH